MQNGSLIRAERRREGDVWEYRWREPGSDPNGAVPLSEALRTELGLKLVKVKAPVPMLVIDQIDETPTPN
jgi:uncharacterized protein (TIGR03435 family)